ncbi:TPA: transcriptional regulator [Candidatus Falkowbacteria bacterium]|nr:transcriptional regulator [Candidatus Falkowbacteria bacterium]HAY12755.1 transcriptional regulator [Candidatus Falkowbacteria bacterium]HBI97490.1 transcriptional regulator [Candidatus Falkowbacteria bacterium]HBT27277.1 transcriptional regulator [Candidatus Falkowbacteria bacterium]HBY15430.1 transcriptional regulator [Candidatus Falkowbacteria bacterium]
MKNNIKQFRKDAGLTQDELAVKVGVRRETIVFLEQGKYSPSLKLALSIAKEFNTTIEELFILS